MKYFFVLLFLIASCKSKYDFYEIDAVSDQIVIPLYKPYRLNQVSDRRIVVGEDWQLDFKYKDSTHKLDYTDVTDVNVTNGIIYGHGKRSKYQPNDWFVIIAGNKIEKVFKTENDWKNYLNKFGITSIKLFQVWDLFYEIRDHSILPWYNPSKGIYP